MLQRAGEVVIRMLGDVKQATIGPLIKQSTAEGSMVYTDEYDIYSRLAEWGYGTGRSAMRRGLTPGTTTGTGSVRCKLTRSKRSGRCCAPGSAPTVGSPRKAYHCTWGTSSSFTMPGLVAGGCWVP